VLNSHITLQIMLTKNKTFSCENVKLRHFGKKTWHFGKITAFTAFDENHGFHDFHVSVIIYCS